MPTPVNRHKAAECHIVDKQLEDADAGPFAAVSFARNMLYWTRLLETSYNRAFLANAPSPTSVSVWRVLAWLSEKDALTVGELALHTHMERTVLGRLLDRMAEQGLISRRPSKTDRRVSMARILSKGRKAFARMQPVREAIYESAVRGIDPAEVEIARRVIVRMVKNLNDPSNPYTVSLSDDVVARSAQQRTAASAEGSKRTGRCL